ncbi:MAG: tetratricopeptide repeat protein [Gemmatimonadota bacterium]
MAAAKNDEIARLEALYAANPRGRVFTHLAEAHRKKGDPERAREILRSGMRDHPDYPSAHVVLGRVLEDVGDETGARDAFQRVIELDPHNMIALRRLAESADRDGRADEALPHWVALQALDPGDEQAAARVAALSEQPDEVEHEPTPAEVDEGPIDDLVAFDGWGDPEAAREEPLAESVLDAPGEGLSLVDLDEADLSLTVDDSTLEAPTLDPEPISAAWPDLADPDAAGGEGQELSGVETETLADLYAAQGLHARAAAVYRRLLERSPMDARLQAKLYEAEARVVGGASEPVRPEWGEIHRQTAAPDVELAAGPQEVEAVSAEDAEVDVGAEFEVGVAESEAATDRVELETPEDAPDDRLDEPTFADPHAYGLDEETELGAAWVEPGALGDEDAPSAEPDPVDGIAVDATADEGGEPGALWTGEDFGGTAFEVDGNGPDLAAEVAGGVDETPQAAEAEGGEPEEPGEDAPLEEAALSAALAGALGTEEVRIRDELRGLIAWSKPAQGAPEADAPAPVAEAERAPAVEEVRPPPADASAARGPATLAPVDLDAEPWADSPSSLDIAGGDSILELGEADLVRSSGPADTGSPQEEDGEIGEIARSLLDASVEPTADEAAESAGSEDDEEVEVFRSWLRSLKK